MDTPFFTIIIPTYNSGKTLQKAIDSLLQQAFADFEVVVVDGVSTDNTLAIVQENSKSDPRIRLLSEKDKGIFDAMNKGIGLAKGEWLYFMGSDDSLYDKGVLQSIYDTLKNTSCDLLYGDVYSFKLKGVYGRAFDRQEILFSNICHQAIFYRRSVFGRMGVYNTAYTSFADWEFNIRCFLDESLREQYINMTVANFAAGGASTVNPDTYFLRNCLLLQNLHFLHQYGIAQLRNIRFYDQWWRLLRSLRLDNDNTSLLQYTGDKPVPAAIRSIADFQKRIPYKLLKMGVVSKTLMALNYGNNLLRNRLH